MICSFLKVDILQCVAIGFGSGAEAEEEYRITTLVFINHSFLSMLCITPNPNQATSPSMRWHQLLFTF